MNYILISGFEPFGGATHNSSQDLVQALGGRKLKRGEIEIVSCLLPVVCDEAWAVLREQIYAVNPLAIVSFGQSKRKGIHLEKYAYNHNAFRIPDNQGNQPQNTEVVVGGKPRYDSSLPIESLVERLTSQKISVVSSTDPGRFVCNNLFYHMQANTEEVCPSGFVHVPFVCTETLIENSMTLLRELAEVVFSSR